MLGWSWPHSVRPAPRGVGLSEATAEGAHASARHAYGRVLIKTVNEPAIDLGVSRLRSALRDRHLVQTVVPRGYGLNV